ncbi:MAG: hypothetical protein F6K47_03970 [Symploca sp. SIO2E6]|nr:hypothetical protein [Symploca sp. SIO2E6]
MHGGEKFFLSGLPCSLLPCSLLPPASCLLPPASCLQSTNILPEFPR